MNLSDCSTAVRTRLGSLYIHLYLQNYKGRNYYHPTLLTDFTRRETVADLGGGCPRRALPLRPKIFSISCSFSHNLVKSYVGAPWRVGAPSYGESWIRPWEVWYYQRKSIVQQQKVGNKIKGNLKTKQKYFMHVRSLLVAHCRKKANNGF